MDDQLNPQKIEVIAPGKPVKKLSTKKERVRRAAIGLVVAVAITVLGVKFEPISLVLVVSMPVAFGLVLYLGYQGLSLVTAAENSADEQWRTARMEKIAESQKKTEEPEETVKYR